MTPNPLEPTQLHAASASRSGQRGAGVTPRDAAAGPRSLILGYVTGDSMTRVRRVAAWGTALSAVLLTAAAALLFWPLIAQVMYGLRWAHSLTQAALRTLMAPGAMFMLGMAVVAGLGALCLFIAAPGVRAGNRAACRLARWGLMPASLVCMGAAALAAAYVLMQLRSLDANAGVLLLVGLGAVIATLVALLIWDTSGFACWIGEHPREEKPPTPFIPGRSAEQVP